MLKFGTNKKRKRPVKKDKRTLKLKLNKADTIVEEEENYGEVKSIKNVLKKRKINEDEAE